MERFYAQVTAFVAHQMTILTHKCCSFIISSV